MTDIRTDRRYSEDHEWVLPLEGTSARVGVSLVATDALGDLVYLDLPEVGAAVTAGVVCGEIESTKSVAELFSPVTGTVLERNEAALDDPTIVGGDPYDDGWLLVVEVTEEGPLLDAEAYTAHAEKTA